MTNEAGSDRSGCLPIETRLSDRIFVSVVLLIAIHFLWMRFLESEIPLYVATIVSLILMVVIIRRG